MTRKGPRPEGLLERLARGIVADELGIPVDRYDDGTADGQPDGMIRLPAGDAPLEVVSDEDPEYASQAAALDKHGRRIEGLDDRAWYVTVRRRTCPAGEPCMAAARPGRSDRGSPRTALRAT